MGLVRTRMAASGVALSLVMAMGVPASSAFITGDSEETSSTTSSPTDDTLDDSTTTTVSPTTTVQSLRPRVLLVGDSTMAALRWFTDAKTALAGATYVVNVESCRSIAERSCWGREQRIPTNAWTAIRTTPGPIDVVVLMAGTHSYYRTIESEFRRVKKLAKKMGVKLVVLSLREPPLRRGAVKKKGLSQIATIDLFLERMFGRPKSDSTYLADWNAFSAGRENWFRRDGIHLNFRGALALGWYISNTVAYVLGAPCPGSTNGVCSMPTQADSLRDWMRIYNVPYTDTHCYEDGSKRKKVCQRDRRMP